MRCTRVVAFALLISCGVLLTANGAQAAPPYAGRRLSDVLRELGQLGLKIVYSDETVPDRLKVEREPIAHSGRPLLEELLAPHGLTRSTERSLILIEGGRAYLRSTASLRIAARLAFPWSLLRVFLIVPAPIRDAVYRIVAGVRHRLAGPSNACDVPPAEIRARLI